MLGPSGITFGRADIILKASQGASRTRISSISISLGAIELTARRLQAHLRPIRPEPATDNRRGTTKVLYASQDGSTVVIAKALKLNCGNCAKGGFDE